MIQPMLDDKREIKSIFREYAQYKVGLNRISKIEIYSEPGQMGFINYAALYRDGQLFARIDLSGWGVEYF
jgi:hypothetical protein